MITDGVFSMDGDLARLPEIVDLAKKYDALTMVDDAHGEGVLGKGGRGNRVQSSGLADTNYQRIPDYYFFPGEGSSNWPVFCLPNRLRLRND